MRHTREGRLETGCAFIPRWRSSGVGVTGVGVGSGSGVVVRVVAEWSLRWLCVVVVLDCAQAGRRVCCSKVEVVEECKCKCNCVVVVLVGVEWSKG